MRNVEALKKYFGNRLIKYNNISLFELDRVSEINKRILIEVGIPDCHSISGVYIPVSSLKIIDNNYLTVQSTDIETNFVCIEISTNTIVLYNLENKRSSFINSNLEIYLTYIKSDEGYIRDIRIPLKFGSYTHDTYEKYANYLQSQFEKINNDYSRGIWSNVLEQMSYGIF